MNIRLIISRILISWWAIPACWLVILPLSYLMSGEFKDSVGLVNELTANLWYGDL